MNAARWVSILFFAVYSQKVLSMNGEQASGFFTLPKTVQIKICQYLDFYQIMTLRRTSKTFKNLLKNVPSTLRRLPVDLKSICKRNPFWQKDLIPPPYEWLPKLLIENGADHLEEKWMKLWERNVTNSTVYKKLTLVFSKNKKTTNLVIDLQESLFLIPPDIKKLRYAQMLTLKGAKCVRHLPEEIGELNDRLHFLSIRHFGIVDLPLSLCRFKKLTHLDLSDNYLTNLTTGLWGLASLKTLNLQNNYLTKLTPEIGQLDKLETLIVSGNHLSALPQELQCCYSLVHMDASCNQISTLPPFLFKNLKKLKRLFLDDNSIEILPPSIAYCKKLETISLRHAQLRSFPKELSYLPYLKNIFLDCNAIEGELNQRGFNRIHFLSLRFTKIKPILQGDCFLRLKKIFLDQETITQYPEEIEQLKNWGIQISL